TCVSPRDGPMLASDDIALPQIRSSMERRRCTMIERLVAGTILALLVVCPAHAQGPENDDNRYKFNRVDDGYFRLDLKNGQVEECSRRTVGWSCLTVPEDRAAFESEIARLQSENVALKKALLDRGLPLPGGVKSEPPAARNGDSDLKLPSNADIDRMMAVV